MHWTMKVYHNELGRHSPRYENPGESHNYDDFFGQPNQNAQSLAAQNFQGGMQQPNSGLGGGEDYNFYESYHTPEQESVHMKREEELRRLLSKKCVSDWNNKGRRNAAETGTSCERKISIDGVEKVFELN